MRHLDVPGRKCWDQRWSDQWVISPQYTPFIRWNNPLILTIDPNFQRDIQVDRKSRANWRKQLLGWTKISSHNQVFPSTKNPMVCSQNIFLLLKVHQQTATTKKSSSKKTRRNPPTEETRKNLRQNQQLREERQKQRQLQQKDRPIDRLGVNLQIITLKLHPRKLNTLED